MAARYHNGSLYNSEVNNLSGKELISPETEKEVISFASDLVKIKSVSGNEEEIIKFIEKKMKSLDYDEVKVDSMGNLLGRVGRGDNPILFDSHVDTVEAADQENWDVSPFSGKIIDGYIYGRGAADMKSGAAASIYAAAEAKKEGLDSGKSVYVSCTVLEEDCDGENLRHLFRELDLRPDCVIICEPSGNRIVLGHKGKAQINVRIRGVSAHGSAPEKGVNAIYEMADIIRRVERTNKGLIKKDGLSGTLVMSKISSRSESLNAVPSECEAHLDRRLAPGETRSDIRDEMDRIIQGKNASWEIIKILRKSWTGMNVEYLPFHPAWEIDPEHELFRACIAAYRNTFGVDPDRYEFWDFSTNAVAPASMGIPVIGFGPGEYKSAHMNNERCRLDQITDACRFYKALINTI
ncbi:MAG: YgeY family selenium metabolism-linked hydrolase [Candidatus Krumholzibacteriales bacterium]